MLMLYTANVSHQVHAGIPEFTRHVWPQACTAEKCRPGGFREKNGGVFRGNFGILHNFCQILWVYRLLHFLPLYGAVIVPCRGKNETACKTP